MIIEPIAYLHNDFKEKFGLPRQSLLCPSLESFIEFEPKYSVAEAVRGLGEYSHLWIIWEFSRNERRNTSNDKSPSDFIPTVRPPRLGGNKRIGVFATRSPFRPNNLGLTCVKLLEVITEGQKIKLKVSGADMMDGTPIYDIKPYIPYADSHPEAVGSFADDFADVRYKVSYDEKIEDIINRNLNGAQREALLEVLSQNPKPGYCTDESREYRMKYAGADVAFIVTGTDVVITDIIFS